MLASHPVQIRSLILGEKRNFYQLTLQNAIRLKHSLTGICTAIHPLLLSSSSSSSYHLVGFSKCVSQCHAVCTCTDDRSEQSTWEVNFKRVCEREVSVKATQRDLRLRMEEKALVYGG